jgi:hypothetical protein
MEGVLRGEIRGLPKQPSLRNARRVRVVLEKKCAAGISGGGREGTEEKLKGENTHTHKHVPRSGTA